MLSRSITVVQTAKVLAVIALVISLVGTITVNLSSRENCRDIQQQNKIVYDSQDKAIKKVESGVQDKAYQRIYGDDWKEVKNQQLSDARALRDRFKPHVCHLPITQLFY